jgi:hypothetical protein
MKSNGEIANHSWNPRVTCYVHGFDQGGLRLGYQQDRIMIPVKTLRFFL